MYMYSTTKMFTVMIVDFFYISIFFNSPVQSWLVAEDPNYPLLERSVPWSDLSAPFSAQRLFPLSTCILPISQEELPPFSMLDPIHFTDLLTGFSSSSRITHWCRPDIPAPWNNRSPFFSPFLPPWETSQPGACLQAGAHSRLPIYATPDVACTLIPPNSFFLNIILVSVKIIWLSSKTVEKVPLVTNILGLPPLLTFPVMSVSLPPWGAHQVT